jgi:hypothetical protein
MTECAEAGCLRSGVKLRRGYCHTHYERRRRAGEFEAVIDRRPPEERFWAKVEKTETCWLWRAALRGGGYGTWNNNGAHRVAYELLVGPIPEGLHLDHLCRVRNCVNPAHLEPVTVGENLRRGVGASAKNAVKTHCPNGHAYSEENTYWYRGARQCLACRTAISARRAAKQKAEREARRSQTEHVPCLVCGEPFPRPMGDGRIRTCSDECRRRHAVVATQRYRQKNR